MRQIDLIDAIEQLFKRMESLPPMAPPVFYMGRRAARFITLGNRVDDRLRQRQPPAWPRKHRGPRLRDIVRAPSKAPSLHRLAPWPVSTVEVLP